MDSEDESDDLEVRMYSMLHYVDHNTKEAPEIISIPPANKFKKTNTPKETLSLPAKIKETPARAIDIGKTKSCDDTPAKNLDDEVTRVANNSQFRSTVKDEHISRKRKYSDGCKKTPTKNNKHPEKLHLLPTKLEQINDLDIVNIDSSDDESIIEIEVPNPPQPICINSSDDESIIGKSTPYKTQIAKKPSISPVPSNMSDDFIRADCSNLNISAESSNAYAFNFGLHGDLGDIQSFTKTDSKTDNSKTLFATPNITSKKKKINKQNNYTVSDQNYILPSVDVYESESSDFPDSVMDVPIMNPFYKPDEILTEEKPINTDSLIMANVINAEENIETEDNVNEISQFLVLDQTGYEEEPPSFTSNINHISSNPCSVKQCLNEMDHYYNKNWGTDFDHVKLKKEMPRDRSYWKVNSADLYRKPDRRNSRVCGFCNKRGHRDEFCSLKPVVCIYCGSMGHKHFKCPEKICLNCGSSSNFITTRCKNCDQFKRSQCDICKEHGHTKKHCPDQWRRYHYTTKNEVPLNEIKERQKPKNLLYCSGCTRKGHIINNCNNYTKFSEFRPSVQHICDYSPVYTPEGVKSSIPSRPITPDKNKALLKSPDITKLVTELNKNSTNNVEQLNIQNLQFTIKNDRMPKKLSELQNPIVIDDDDYSPAFKKIKPDAQFPIDEENLVMHNALNQKLYVKLSTIAGKIFLLDLSNKTSVKYFVQKTSTGGDLILNGTAKNQQKFLEKISELVIGNIIPSGEVPFLLKDNYLPRNRMALIQRITHDIILLNNNLGKPSKFFKSALKMQRLSKRVKTVLPNLVYNTSRDNLSTCYKYLNMILIGQMGKNNGNLTLKKLEENLTILHNSTIKFVSSSQMKEIEKSYFPIFSSQSLYNYDVLIYKKKLMNRLNESVTKITKKEMKVLYSSTMQAFNDFHNSPKCDVQIKNLYSSLVQNKGKLKKTKDKNLQSLVISQCRKILSKLV